MTLHAIYGGARMDRQIRALHEGVDLVIATPGRVIDLMQQGELSMADIDHVVVDEADRMADMGFLPQVEWILRHVRGRHQTLLFSATLDGAVGALVSRYQHDPVLPPGQLRSGHRRGDGPPLPARARDGQGEGGGGDRRGPAPAR